MEVIHTFNALVAGFILGWWLRDFSHLSRLLRRWLRSRKAAASAEATAGKPTTNCQPPTAKEAQ